MKSPHENEKMEEEMINAVQDDPEVQRVSARCHDRHMDLVREITGSDGSPPVFTPEEEKRILTSAQDYRNADRHRKRIIGEAVVRQLRYTRG